MSSVHERLDALVQSGQVRPLRPLADAGLLPSREAFEGPCAAIVQAVAQLLPEAGARLPAHLAVFPGLQEAVTRELAAGARLGFTRLDVACPPEAPERFQLLEVQAGDPSAMGWHDALAEAFGQPPALMPAHRRTLEALTAGRRIAFAVQRGSVVESDHQLLAEHYRRYGWQAWCVDPSELTFDGQRLLARGEPVQALFRDALDELLTGAAAAGGAAVLEAQRAGAVVVMNPFSAALADDKSLLEPLSMAEALAAHVPWTRVVRERPVRFEGEDWALPALLRARRERLVLKPVDGYGGFGVKVGPYTEPAEWEAAVAAALARPGSFVAQAYCPLPRQAVRTLEGGAPGPAREAWVVHSLWYVGGLAGAFLRASGGPVVNVHQGGGLAPVFFQPR